MSVQAIRSDRHPTDMNGPSSTSLDDTGALSAAHVEIERLTVERPTALLTIDIEPDYNSIHQRGLESMPRLLELIDELSVPLTAFVEGRLLRTRPDLCALLAEANVDVQLHCNDHTLSGDTPEQLTQGVAAYQRFFGRAPSGYRAHTFRLSSRLYRALLTHDFKWDSSILPGFGLGGTRDPAFRNVDYLRLDKRLIEFPVATWGGLGIPLTHSYRRVLKPPLEAVLRRLCPLPALLVYDMHMVDLVWTGSLWSAPLPTYLKALYGYSWGMSRTDSFDSLRNFIQFLRDRDYTFSTVNGFYNAVTN